MKKLWLIFAQTTTVGLAVWFLIALLHPDWLPKRTEPPEVVVVQSSEPKASPASGVPSYRDAARRAMPAVVNIYTAKETKFTHPLLNDPAFRRFFDDRLDGDEAQRTSSLGSGVIVSAEGYIVTNNHVVESADEIEVALADGRTAEARLIGTDPETDLAVIRVELPNLPTVTFADDTRTEIGDVVLAIGNPFGVGQTVTMGIVSATKRTQLGINTFENFIQTDAAINPGNSGGALIDTRGNLLGINTAIYSRTGGSLGIGFAIPASSVKQVMDAIIKDGSVVRGWLGVEPQDVTAELASSFKLKEARGALVAGVVRGSPADKGGLKPGDIVLAIGGQDVGNTLTMLNLIAALQPDQQVDVRLFRDGREITVPVKIGKRPAFRQP
ncbi:Do family serine endopeptidase [Chitiniphilus eburneus]|uniref:Do family serine endopeptidase n=1 Tax=Chitiniphilus eburneus TaxID=2571148 RepID=A0A4U0QCJ2_9NEIS|nr:Do family serine endopeptidase [Chitiniphilus eburneus]TJZ79129.1 Do family serine endopeptidase [Chitiniphilus eburneus]